VAYLRFIVSSPHPDTGVAAGVFTVAYGLCSVSDTSERDRKALTEQLQWFSKNLPVPKRFSRSTSAGFYRRKTNGIAWFRDVALEHLSRMHELKLSLEENGYIVHMVKDDRVGYIVYKDDAQVIAEPFGDTRTDK
jgi:hypothetical protein